MLAEKGSYPPFPVMRFARKHSRSSFLTQQWFGIGIVSENAGLVTELVFLR
jgi:hypothetical protein